MSTPPPSPRTKNEFFDSSESLVESSSQEKIAVNTQSKSTSPPVMKTKTKKSDQRDAYKASASTTYTEKNDDIGKNFKIEIDTARRLIINKKKRWEKISKKISLDGIFLVRANKKNEIIDLVEWLKTNPKETIIKLDLRFKHIDDGDAKALAEALKIQSTITTLNLSCNQIGAVGANALAEALKNNSTITTLSLSNNHIGAEIAKALVEALKNNSTITTLNLSYNHIGAVGANALAEALKNNSTITTLNLSYNDIRDEGAKALAEVLKNNSTITSLNLSYNDIRDEGAKALAEVLKNNSTITSLNLSYNHIGAEGANAFAEMLSTNRTITTISFEDNDLYDESAIKIVIAIIDNPNSAITAIDLSGNKIEEEGVEAIANALIANPDSKITDLDVLNDLSILYSKNHIEIIQQQCELNAQRALIENNIAGALDLLTAETSLRDVNDLISQKLFALDKADKLNTAEVINDPNSVFSKYT